jgi:2,5-diketo-D-gluconate reductase A
VNQIELHPSFQQTELTGYSAARGIAVEAYSPLGQGKDLTGTVVSDIAVKHGKSPAQVVLRWHLQRGIIVIPKSASAHRMHENIDVFDFSLDEDEVARITGLEIGMRRAYRREFAVIGARVHPAFMSCFQPVRRRTAH